MKISVSYLIKKPLFAVFISYLQVLHFFYESILVKVIVQKPNFRKAIVE